VSRSFHLLAGSVVAECDSILLSAGPILAPRGVERSRRLARARDSS
jgi:hypothetical protein